MDPCDVLAALFRAELLHRLQVDAPVPPANDEGGEPLALENPPRLLGLQVRADRHARLKKPGGRADADEVVVALPCVLRDLYLAGRAAHLRRKHAEDVAVRMSQRQSRESLRPALVYELDSRLPNLAA